MKLKELFSLLLAIILLIPGIAIPEGLLPSLDEVYGVEVPSFANTIKKKPDRTEENDLGTISYYSGVTDDNYYAYGNVLEQAGCKVLDYTVNGTAIEITISYKEKAFTVAYDIANASMTIIYPDGIYDEVGREKESKYTKALEYIEKGNYANALAVLKQITEYEDVPQLTAEVYYKLGMAELKKGEAEAALNHLKMAESSPEVQSGIARAYNDLYMKTLKVHNFKKAESIIQEAKNDNVIINEFKCYQVGDISVNVKSFLDIVKDMGYLKKSGQIYESEYVNGIKSLETRLGLTVDGVIYSDELLSIGTTLYPSKKSHIKALIEHLADAGYTNGMLPDNHDSYLTDFTNYVIKAKKACKLPADKLITKAEYETLMNLPILNVDPVTSIKATATSKWNTNTTVNLTWKASKNALFYNIYANNTLIAKINGTSYKHQATHTNMQYSIEAANYESASTCINADPIRIGPEAETITLDTLLKQKDFYIGKDLFIDDEMKILSITATGNTLYVLQKGKDNDLVIFIRLENYKSLGIKTKGSDLYTSAGTIDYIKPFGSLLKVTRSAYRYGEVDQFQASHYLLVLK